MADNSAIGIDENFGRIAVGAVWFVRGENPSVWLVDHYGEFYLVLGDVLFDLGDRNAVVMHADDRQASGVIKFICENQVRQILGAIAAPRGPEMEQQVFSAEIG